MTFISHSCQAGLFLYASAIDQTFSPSLGIACTYANGLSGKLRRPSSSSHTSSAISETYSSPAQTSEAWIIVTKSSLHLCCRELDLDQLTTPTHSKSQSRRISTFQIRQLSLHKRDQHDPAGNNILVFFPDNSVTEQWKAWDEYVGKVSGEAFRYL